jgi:hypothetical protein
MDLEAGDLAIKGWTGDSIRPRTWTECRDFAVFIGGPNPHWKVELSIRAKQRALTKGIGHFSDEVVNRWVALFEAFTGKAG